MSRQPVLFVSHGAPDILLNPAATVAVWHALGIQLPRPRGILVISAHWAASTPTLSLSSAPETIHDFGGFPPALYQMHYPAPGAPELARRAGELLAAAGLPHRFEQRGLDHGAWIPLKALYPNADVPVTQLALQPMAGPQWHVALGAALAPLRDEGILILASGATTHNFGWLNWGVNGAPRQEAVIFSDWLADALARNDRAALLDYRRSAPHGAGAHPTEEHLLPLFAALGAADADELPLRINPEFTYGGLAMDIYLWQQGSPTSFQGD